MSFRLGLIFSEVGIDFPVSYKVNQLILDKLIIELPSEHQNISIEGKKFSLGVVISTKKSKNDLSIQGPDISKKYKMVDYTIWVPYRKVIDSGDVLKTYLDFTAEGIRLVFKELGYDNGTIVDKVFKEVKKSVLNNPIYQYDASDDQW